MSSPPAAYETLIERIQALQEAQARMQRAKIELEIQLAIERRIAQLGGVEDVLAGAIEQACTLLEVEAAALLIANEAGGRLFVHRTSERQSLWSSLESSRLRAWLGHAQLPLHRVRDESGALADLLPLDAVVLQARESFTAPLSDARTTIGIVQLINRIDSTIEPEWLLSMLSLLAAQITRAVVIERERSAAERVGRMATLGHSVSAILHDLRTPMTAVGGYAERMATESDPALRKTYLERIGRALEHMEAMTQEVLAFARGKRDILLQRVELSRFIEAVREMLLPETARYGTKLVINAEYDGVASFDENKLKRAIFNLARNACQAMKQGGTLSLSVRREGEQLIFECADTGPGIAQELDGKSCESFATHGNGESTGLGLAMVKKIVDAHCGRITYRSIAGEGASFRIELPC